MVCGLLVALSVTVTFPVRTPRAVGLKVTNIVQPDLAGNAAGTVGQFEVCVKSPEMVMLLILSGVVRLFVSRNDCGVLEVLMTCGRNEKEDGRATGTTPAPLRAAV